MSLYRRVISQSQIFGEAKNKITVVSDVLLLLYALTDEVL
jgi:hypothetical protein